MRILPLWLVLSLAAVTRAQGQPADMLHFSDRGRVMVGGSATGYWSSEEAFAGRRTFNDWEVSAWPGITYFMGKRLGIGISGGAGLYEVTWAYTRERGRIAGGFANVLYDLRLSERVSLLPWLSVGWLGMDGESRLRSSALPTGSDGVAGASPQTRAAVVTFRDDYHHHLLRTSLFLPLTFFPSPSVALGFGPMVLVDRTLVSRAVRRPGDDSAPEMLGPYIYRASSLAADNDRTVEEAPKSRVRIGAATWIGASF